MIGIFSCFPSGYVLKSGRTVKKMKMVRFWVLFLIVSCSSAHVTSSLISGDNVAAAASASKRKLAEKINTQKKIIKDNVNLEDYNPIDPVPSSSAATTSGPIEHGTPVMPFVPKPSPPYHPFPGGSSLPPPA